MNKKRKHVSYYVSLLGMLILGSFLVYLVSPNRQLQMFVFITMALFYIILGIVHHKANHDLTAKIVVEYILIGGLGIAIMFFLFKGGFGL